MLTTRESNISYYKDSQSMQAMYEPSHEHHVLDDLDILHDSNPIEDDSKQTFIDGPLNDSDYNQSFKERVQAAVCQTGASFGPFEQDSGNFPYPTSVECARDMYTRDTPALAASRWLRSHTENLHPTASHHTRLIHKNVVNEANTCHGSKPFCPVGSSSHHHHHPAHTQSQLPYCYSPSHMHSQLPSIPSVADQAYPSYITSDYPDCNLTSDYPPLNIAPSTPHNKSTLDSGNASFPSIAFTLHSTPISTQYTSPKVSDHSIAATNTTTTHYPPTLPGSDSDTRYHTQISRWAYETCDDNMTVAERFERRNWDVEFLVHGPFSE